MKGFVYKISNLVNSEVYVGSTINFRKRKDSHFADLKTGKHSCKRLQLMFDDLGEQNFIIEIIENVDVKAITDLRKREQHFLDMLKPRLNRNSAFKEEMGLVRINPDSVQMVRDYVAIHGGTIGRFYKEAADKLLAKKSKK